MGNFHSTWSSGAHRHESRARGGEGEGRRTRRSSHSTGGGIPASGPLNVAETAHGHDTVPSDAAAASPSGAEAQSLGATTRYSLRRTHARQARAVNASTSSLDSVASTASGGPATRRRRREQLDPDESDSEARRRRIEGLERAAFTPEADDDPGQSLFFYFSLPGEVLGSQARVGDDSVAPTTRRRSGRLQQAADFLRERLGMGPSRRSAESTAATPQPPPISPLTPEAAGSAAGERPMVLVRLRHVQQPAAGEGERSVPPGGTPNNGPETASASPAATAASPDPNSVFQWTIYFVIPRPETAAEDGTPRDGSADASNEGARIGPSQFDAALAVQSAFAVLRALMSGENMGYEEWTRLQEALGTVSRGVAKELIEEQLPAKLFTPSLGMISCPICLAEYEGGESLRTLPCAHSFHALCIDTWLIVRNDCPLCRQPPVTVPI